MSQDYVQKATGTSPTGLTDSQVFDDGTNVGVGTATPALKLDVVGSISDDWVAINVTNTNAGSDALSARTTHERYCHDGSVVRRL
jgi:hypothetical protein